MVIVDRGLRESVGMTTPERLYLASVAWHVGHVYVSDAQRFVGLREEWSWGLHVCDSCFRSWECRTGVVEKSTS